MKEIKTEDAIGSVLCHDITEIVKDQRKGPRFKKGHIIKEEDIEVLLIDDGSTDSSGKICKSFCEKDSRFKYIYKQNGGVSSARNAGLIEATGDFIGFVDPDDFINKEMYHTLINQADIDELDIVACGINIIDGDNVTKIVNSDNEYYNSCKALENLLRWSYDVSPYLWNKIFRKNCFRGY